MNILIVSLYLIIFIHSSLGVSLNYEDDDYLEDVKDEEQYCYSCSGKSALCRDEGVYDGLYLTKTACKTKCFLRVENNEIYRGCFDGWLGGLVKYDYEGCKLQKYLGQTVEWCFCSGDSQEDSDSEPCNAISRKSMGGGLISYNSDLDEEDAEEYEGRYALSEYNNYVDGYLEDSSRIEGKEGSDNHYKFAIADTLPYYNDDEEQDEYYKDDADYYRRRSDKKKALLLKSAIKGHPCSVESNGLILDPEDCSSYYLCSNGIPYHMNCPAGTVWNQKLRGCAFMFDPSYPCEMVTKNKGVGGGSGTTFGSSKKAAGSDHYATNYFLKEDSEEDDFRYEPYLSELEKKYLKQKAEEYARQVEYMKKNRRNEDDKVVRKNKRKEGQSMKLGSDGTYEKVFSVNKGKSVLKESAYNVAGA